MDPAQRALLVVVLLAAASAAALLVRRARGRLRIGHGRVVPVELLPADGAAQGVVVQLTTRWCSSCGPAARTWRAAAERAGLAFHQIDIGERIELARELDVLTTPTALVLDRTGRERGRVVGAPTLRQALDAVAVRHEEPA